MPFKLIDEQSANQANVPSLRKRFVIEEESQINETKAQKIHRIIEPYFEPALEAGMSTAGAIALTPLGPGGTVGGGAAGFAGAKRLEKLIEDMIGVGEPETIGEGFVQTGKDLATGALFEAGGLNVGAGVSAVGKKVLAPQAARMADEVFDPKLKKNVPTTEASTRMRLAQEGNITVTPAEITQSKPLSLIESLLDKIAFSAGQIQDARILQLKELATKRLKLLSKAGASDAVFDDISGKFVAREKKALEEVGLQIQDQVSDYLKTITEGKVKIGNDAKNLLLSKLGIASTFDDLGRGVKEVIKTRSQVWQEAGQVLFAEAGEAIPKGVTTEITNVKQTALSLLKQQMKRDPEFRTKPLVTKLMSLSGMSPKALSVIDSLPEAQAKQVLSQIEVKYDWEKLQFLVQDLNSLIASSDEAVKIGQSGVKGLSSVEGGAYKLLKKAAVKDIDAFSSRLGGTAKAKLDEANAFWAQGKEVWKSKIMKKLLSNNPDKVVDLVIKPNQTSDIKVIKKAIGVNGFKIIKGGFSNKLLNAFSPDKPKALGNMLSKYGDDVLKEIYTPKEIAELKQLASLDLKIDASLASNRFFRAIVKTAPERVVSQVVKPDNTRNLDIIQKIVGKDGMKDIAAKHLERIMALNQHELFSPARFVTQLSRFGERTNKRLFTPEVWSELKKLGQVSQIARGAELLAGNPSGTAQNLISFITGGMVLRDPIGKAWIVVAPNLLARAYLSKPAIRWLTTGFKMPSTSPQAVGLFSKLSAILGVGAESRRKESRRKNLTRNRRRFLLSQ